MKKLVLALVTVAGPALAIVAVPALAIVAVPALAADIPLDLAGLPRVPAVLVAHGKSQQCEGVRLGDLLARAGVPAGEAVRGEALTTVVIATAADGYRVVFSLAEIDTKLGNHGVFVVDRCAGKALETADGPLRLVVPGEARGARSVRQLTGLRTATVSE
jgi:hypothetical protein